MFVFPDGKSGTLDRARRWHMEFFLLDLNLAGEILTPNFLLHAPGLPSEMPRGPQVRRCTPPGSKARRTHPRPALLRTGDQSDVPHGG